MTDTRYQESLLDSPPAYTAVKAPEKAPPAYEWSGTDKTQFNNDPKLVDTCKKRGISPIFASQLQYVRHFRKIRIAIDISGSMGSAVWTPRDKSGSNTVSASQGERKTRWQELREQLKLLCDVCFEQELTQNGIDVFFIQDRENTCGVKDQDDVKSWRQLEGILPNSLGYSSTPTLATVERMFEPTRMTPQEAHVLTVIFTDGVPTDGGIIELKKILTEKQKMFTNSHVAIVLCTDNLRVVDSFNQLDKTAPKLDVMDDFVSERAEIRKKQGFNFSFSRDDYVVKLLLGSSVELWDRLDEEKMTAKEVKRFKKYERQWDWDGRNAQKLVDNMGGQKEKPMLQKITTGLGDLWREAWTTTKCLHHHMSEILN